MEKSMFAGFILGVVLAWARGLLKPVGEGGEKWEKEPSTSEYYWRV